VKVSFPSRESVECGVFHTWVADGNGLPHAVVEFGDGRVETVRFTQVAFSCHPHPEDFADWNEGEDWSLDSVEKSDE